MNMKRTDLLAATREIASRVIEEHFQNEYRYFSLVWQAFRQNEDAVGSAVRYKGAPFDLSVLGLSFAQPQGLRLVAPFAIIAVYAVLQELEQEVAVPETTAVCAAMRDSALRLGAPVALAERIARCAGPQIHELFTRSVLRPAAVLPKGKQQVTVYADGGVLIEGAEQPATASDQERLLFLELVRKGRLHWLWGYVIFTSWSNRRIKNPAARFGNVVSRLNRFFRDSGARLAVDAEKTGKRADSGWWLFRQDEVDLAGPVREAVDLALAAERHLREEEHKEAWEKAADAMRRDPADADAARSLVCAADNLEPEVTRASVLGAAHMLVAARLRGLQAAERVASSFSEMESVSKSPLVWPHFEAARQLLRQEVGYTAEADEVARNLIEQITGGESPADVLRRVRDLLDLVRSGKRADSAFDDLVTQPAVKAALNGARANLCRVFPTQSKEDIAARLTLLLREKLTCGERWPTEHESPIHLRHSWRYLLTTAGIEAITEDLFGITSHEHGDARALAVRLRKTGRSLEDMEAGQLPPEVTAHWTTNRVEKAEDALRSLGEAFASGQIAFGAYWSAFRRKRVGGQGPGRNSTEDRSVND